MQAISTVLRKLKRSHSERARLEAKAANATIYVARDGRGRVVGAR
jgi:hypothetical protein